MDQNGKDEKLTGGEIVVKNRFLLWLDNFWYHNKWIILIAVFFIAVFVICFAQCAAQGRAGMRVTFAGGKALTGTEIEGIQEVLSATAPRDGEERRTVALQTYPAYTEDELRALATDEDGNYSVQAFEAGRQQTVTQVNSFSDYLMTGDCALFFVSEFVYTERNLSTLAVPLSESFGDATPSSSFDAYAVRLKDTAFYDYYDAFHVLPDDTLVILTRKFLVGTDADDYDIAVSLYRSILSFEKP